MSSEQDAAPMMTEPDGIYAGPSDDPDRYRLVDAVAGGGEGEVYGGRLKVQGREVRVAVKVYRAKPGEDPGNFHRLAARWRDQLHLVQSITHPAIVRMRETFVGSSPHRPGEEGRGEALYLVMDWVEGDNLAVWAGAHPERSYSEVSRILTAVCSGLVHLHSGIDTGQPILHRDVKPENVIVQPDGRVVLVDFGLARGVDRAVGKGGTPGYRAPEVANGAEHSVRSDLFGAAGVAYFLFTGQNPPEPPDPARIRSALSASPLVRHLPEVVGAVMGGLAADPVKRPSSVHSWANAVRQSSVTTTSGPTAAGDPVGGGTETRQLSVLSSPPRRRRTAAGALAMLLAVALVAAFVTFGPDGAGDRNGGKPVASKDGSDTGSPDVTDTTGTTDSTTTTTRPATTTLPTTTTTLPQTRSLAELEPVLDGGRWRTGDAKVNGTPYIKAVIAPNSCTCCRGGESDVVDYDLNRRFRRLSGVVGVDDASRPGHDVRFVISSVEGGGERALGQWEQTFGTASPIDLDVSGVLRLRITVEWLYEDLCHLSDEPLLTAVFGAPTLE